MESEAQFIRGFNNGYLLEQHEPSLLAKVLHNLAPVNDYVSGLHEGQKEYQQERTREELNSLAALRDKGKEHGRENER